MLNQNSINQVGTSKFGDHFVKPLYDSYCFSRIPHTVINELTHQDNEKALPKDILPEGATSSSSKKYKKAVFLFVDAFGWVFYEKYKDKYPSLKRFLDNGKVSKLTSQFPSTTPVHVTTINTAQEVGEHGVYEWFYYEPLIDAVMAPLLFSFAGDHGRETLQTTGIDPRKLYPNKTIYQLLAEKNIKSHIVSSLEFSGSSYNEVICQGATATYPYATVSQAFTILADKLLEEQEQAYFSFYYSKIDTMGHIYGPDSDYFVAEVDAYFTALENSFFKRLDGKLDGDTLILMSADHGQTRIHPEKTIYLDKLVPGIAEFFIKTKAGAPIVPVGACRDMFLHVEPARLQECKKLLDDKLAGKAEVHIVEDLIADGFFGTSGKAVSETFLSRVGNLVVLPFSEEAVWWYEEGRFEQNLNGHHGGLTPKEMEIPLLALTL